MPAAKLPANELKRLEALKEYRILDTCPERQYDDIVKLAAQICGSPIALISLVDSERQWFKAKTGIEAESTHRDLAFCAHAILNPAVALIVNDAALDSRFIDNALVLEDPKIRFYAGFPLVNPNGFAIGTLCAIDTKPSEVNSGQIEALQALARLVMTLCESRKTEFLLKKNIDLLNVSEKISDVGHWEVDMVHNKLFWSEGVYAIHEVTKEEYFPEVSTALQYYHYDDRERITEIVKNAIALRQNFSFESRIITNKGNIKNVISKSELELDQSGNLISIVGVFKDITEQKRAIEQKEELISTLVKSNEKLESFAYICSHDLQEPLRMITSFAELLERKYSEEFDDDARKYLSLISDYSTRMRQMIDDMLEYSKTEYEYNPPKKIDLNNVLQLVKQNLLYLIDHTKAEIISANLPVVMSDSISFACLLQNLIGNAIKYSKSDVSPKIIIDVVENQYDYVFSVTDNGLGIRQEYCEQIFLPFKRLHSSYDYSGTGMGLAICKKIVEKNGGKIWAESESGKGSTFYFTFPKNL